MIGMEKEKRAVDIVIPVYNETLEQVEKVIDIIWNTLNNSYELKIIVVDDGTDKKFGLEQLKGNEKITFIVHEINKGYGSSLKTGIQAGNAPWIGIVDADATYPVEQFVVLLEAMEGADMVIGTRTGHTRQIPWIRRFPKFCLNKFASYMANQEIVDINSGMRVFSRELSDDLWSFFPKRFSFTSTLTMGGYLYDYTIRKVSIDYFKRQGKSSIKPIHDTLHFANIILRMGLLFHPLKVFSPLAYLLLGTGVIKGLFIDYIQAGFVGNLAVFSMLSGIQILLMGYLADLVVRSRYVRQQK